MKSFYNWGDKITKIDILMKIFCLVPYNNQSYAVLAEWSAELFHAHNKALVLGTSLRAWERKGKNFTNSNPTDSISFFFACSYLCIFFILFIIIICSCIPLLIKFLQKYTLILLFALLRECNEYVNYFYIF